MPEITLIRHGQTAWSLSGQHTGVTDIALTSAGESQARALGTRLLGHDFGLILCSPRLRARCTLELAGVPDYVVDDNLAEWDYGSYEGLTSAEISADLGRPWSLWTDGVPGGETGEQVAARALAVLNQAEPILTDGRDVLLAAHGHILRVLAATWLGMPFTAGAFFALSAGSLSTLGYEHSQRVITGWNADR